MGTDIGIEVEKDSDWRKNMNIRRRVVYIFY